MLNLDRNNRDGDDGYSLRNTSKLIRYAIIGVAVIVVLLLGNPLGTVGAGERGILLRFNAVTGTIYDEGLYFRWPLIERVIIVDIKIQKEQADATAASKDLQTVHSDVAVNFHIGAERVASIYQEVGIDYKQRLIDPTL